MWYLRYPLKDSDEYLTVGTTEHGVAETPEELLKRMDEIEAERRQGL